MPKSRRITTPDTPSIPDSGKGGTQSGFAARIADYEFALAYPPDGRGPLPPPVPRLGPTTHRGGVRMRDRDLLALRLRMLSENPPPETKGGA